MAGAQRFAIALLAGLMLLSSLPHTTAESNDETSLSLEITTDESLSAFIEGQSIEIDSILINYGNAEIYQENPSCGVYITVENQENQIVYSNFGECRNQIRDSIIYSNEAVEQPSQIWDFKNNENEYVESGKYRIKLHHSILELNDTINLQFVKMSTINQNLKLDVKLNKISTISQTEAYAAQILVNNPSQSIVDLNNEKCLIIISNADYIQMIDSCYGNTELFHPNENIYAGHIIILENNYDYSLPITFQLYGSEEIVSVAIPGHEQRQNDEAQDDEQSIQQISSVLSIDHYTNEDSVSFFATFAEPNTEDQIEVCDASVTIFHDFGAEYLSNQINLCDEEQLQLENNVKKIFQWNLKNDQQCFIEMGTYNIIIEIENNFFSFDYQQFYKNTEVACLTKNIEVDFRSSLIDYTVFSDFELSTNQEIMRVDTNCLAGLKIEISLLNSVVNQFCGFTPGNFFTMNGEKIEFSHQLELGDSIEDYDLNVQFSTFNGLVMNEYFSIKVNNNDVNSTNDYFQIDGIWKNIEYGQNECWIINSPNNAHIIDSNLLTSQWSPKEDWTGSYLVSKAENDIGSCGIFGIQLVEIDEIYFESEPERSIVTELEIEAPDEIDVVAIAVTGTASASIILTLVLLISNTESLRIPVTSLGLWMFALVGKTHETSDGRFQRGRLIGYLTANPGCHFRALMAALNMSNGQITHHLRLLENQELIWRINDGRFVRYYPLNNSLYPGMNPEELPIPPLSPDPNSLQGKILTLLDDEHQLGEFPTQSELAKKLEKSQQLISHHLRTLQKFGLVEKRKMGIKNRYKLTKEALFLLETDMEFTKVRD